MPRRAACLGSGAAAGLLRPGLLLEGVPQAPHRGAAGRGGRAQELLQFARGLERLAARYLDQLDDARQTGEQGEDPRAQRALERLEAGVEGVAQRVLRRAHVLRYEMLVARREAGAGAGAGEVSSGDLDSTRVESPVGPEPTGPVAQGYDPAYDPAVLRRVSPALLRSGAGVDLDSTRGEMSVPLDSTRVEFRPVLDPTRVESPVPARAADPSRAARVPAQEQQEPGRTTPDRVPGAADPRLMLSAQPLPVLPPTGRGLGEPVRSYALGRGLVHLTWPRYPGVQAVEYDRQLVGWVEEGLVDVLGEAWAAVLDGRLVLDAEDGEPMLSPDPGLAVTLLGLARQQRLA